MGDKNRCSAGPGPVDGRRKKVKKESVFHAPLDKRDRPDRTFGCRYTNPDICKKHSMEGVCAFVREDNMCISPPASWPKQYEKLSGQRSDMDRASQRPSESP